VMQSTPKWVLSTDGSTTQTSPFHWAVNVRRHIRPLRSRQRLSGPTTVARIDSRDDASTRRGGWNVLTSQARYRSDRSRLDPSVPINNWERDPEETRTSDLVIAAAPLIRLLEPEGQGTERA